MPRSEGIETSTSIFDIASTVITPERMPRSEGIETPDVESS